MPLLATAANTAWMLGNVPAAAAFRKALDQPGETQRRILQHYLRDNGDTLYGTRHHFANIQ